jgi:hypothetical protein
MPAFDALNAENPLVYPDLNILTDRCALPHAALAYLSTTLNVVGVT